MISLMFGFVIGAMGLILQLALWMIQANIVVGMELCTIAFEFIINILRTCFVVAGASISSRKSVETKPVVKYVSAKDTHRSLSKREYKEVEKSVRREIKKAHDDGGLCG